MFLLLDVKSNRLKVRDVIINRTELLGWAAAVVLSQTLYSPVIKWGKTNEIGRSGEVDSEGFDGMYTKWLYNHAFYFDISTGV